MSSPPSAIATGAAYVNDFVEFGRIYQVKIEAGGQAQKVIDDVMRLSLENSSGKMVPFSAFTEAKQQLGLDQINLYNMYSSASITCIANPKYSSGEAIQAMEELITGTAGRQFRLRMDLRRLSGDQSRLDHDVDIRYGFTGGLPCSFGTI